jgi:Ca2+-binding RTX toxin-like protein
VNGNAQARGSGSCGGGNQIGDPLQPCDPVDPADSITEGVSPVTVVTDISYPAYNSDSTGISPPGAYDASTYDLTVDPGQTVTLDPGTYSFNKITLKTGAKLAMTGPVVIYMTDRFYANNGAVVNTSKTPANLMIISSMSGRDAITTEKPGSGEFYGGIYALNGEVEFNDGGWKIYGAIVADKIRIKNDARFHYDVALAQLSIPAGKFRPAAGTWRELFP